MSDTDTTLAEAWRLRNAAAVTLGLAEDQMRRAIRAASLDALVALLDTFAPGRSAGPDWTRSFEPLMERLWQWRDDATMAALAEVYRARGLPWAGVANALSPEHGARQRSSLRHPAGARLPTFTTI